MDETMADFGAASSRLGRSSQVSDSSGCETLTQWNSAQTRIEPPTVALLCYSLPHQFCILEANIKLRIKSADLLNLREVQREHAEAITG